MRLGWPEILLILAIVLIVFGVGKLPQIGGALGKSIRSFKKAQAGDDEEDEKTKAVAKSETKSEKKSET
jgi:sec-independent protein translocase protein TatA